jgi:septal ring factor EnvC (AmiA/AmiB activator)
MANQTRCIEHAERLASLETSLKDIKGGLGEAKGTIHRIEKKVDNALVVIAKDTGSQVQRSQFLSMVLSVIKTVGPFILALLGIKAGTT